LNIIITTERKGDLKKKQPAFSLMRSTRLVCLCCVAVLSVVMMIFRIVVEQDGGREGGTGGGRNDLVSHTKA
jgi:hypothetical protein